MTTTHKHPKRRMAVFAVLSTLAAIVSAEITFTSPPANQTYRPGDFVALTWTVDTPAPGSTVPPNTEPFDLVLRALSGQRYDIQAGVVQSLLSFRAQIPASVTGGLHSFYADYRGTVAGQKNGVSTRQFNIPLPIVNVTSTRPPTGPATSTAPPGPGDIPADGSNGGSGSKGGFSPVVLGGIIIGVIVALLAVAMVFLSRHRRRKSAENKAGSSRSMEGGHGGSKEGKQQDKETHAGFPQRSEGQEAVPLKLNRPLNSSPRPQHQDQHQQQDHQQRPVSPNSTRNPFEAPELMIHSNASAVTEGGSPRQQNQHHHQYQPPSLPPPQQSPFGSPPQQYSNIPPNPLMHGQSGQQQRSQSPYHQNKRISMESELEPAYDPHPRTMTPPIHRNNSSPKTNGSPLGHSSSSGSSRYPHNMSPQPSHGNPFNQQSNQSQSQQDREILAVAAAVAAAASPVPAHRQVQNNQQSQMQQRSAPSPRIKEIEMQQFDVHQHHQEQQQKMMQRQQQQQLEQQQSRSAQSTPLPAAQKSMNPTQFDDKAEFEDSDSDSDNETPVASQKQQSHPNPFQNPEHQQKDHVEVKPAISAVIPVPPPASTFTAPAVPTPPMIEDGSAYNGYRDTIFGAYATTPGDDDDDEDNLMPVLPTPIPITQIASPPMTAYQPPPGGAEIVRKKSVKFTGVAQTGPIVLPNHEAAKEHQQQRQQIKQQQQQQQQQQQTHNQGQEDDSDEFYSDGEIRARMLETAESMNSPSASSRPTVVTNNSNNNSNNTLSPVRTSPASAHQQYSNNPYQLGEDEDSTDEDEDYLNDAYTTPQPPFNQQQQQQQQYYPRPGGAEDSPRLNAVMSPTSDDDFFGDVLAAVEKTNVPLPPPPLTTSQSQFNPDSYTKPKLPPMPPSSTSNTIPQSPPVAPPAQFTVQQQHIPPAQPQHLTHEVFGAPSPRMKPAALPTTAQQYQQQHGYPAPPPPAPPARAKGHSPVAARQQLPNNINDSDNDSYF
ncbi:hypothetical protein FBU30_008998 [Linnemannia zychae]|nr:hypothetical protein FBU30_008998 [Linnemannia zychae]